MIKLSDDKTLLEINDYPFSWNDEEKYYDTGIVISAKDANTLSLLQGVVNAFDFVLDNLKTFKEAYPRWDKSTNILGKVYYDEFKAAIDTLEKLQNALLKPLDVSVTDIEKSDLYFAVGFKTSTIVILTKEDN